MVEIEEPSVDVTIRLKARWLPALVIVFAIVQQVSPGKVWMAVSTIFGGIWLLAYLWAKGLAAGLRISREHKFGWSQVGDVFEERILLEDRSFFPALWLLINDESTLVGHSISLGTGINGNSSRRWTKRTACEKRGEYQLGPTTLETGDPFGIYQVTIFCQNTLSFVVAPPAITLPGEIQISTGLYIHDGRSMNKKTERSNVSISTREFVIGDSLTRIHWLITAKEDVPHVRQFENIHASDSCWIVLDLDSNAHFPGEENNSVEQSIILAVSLANRMLLKGLAVGLLSKGSRFVLLPPGKGPGQFRQVQTVLASIQPGGESLQKLLYRSWRQFGDKNTVVVITASKQSEWLEHLGQLKRRHLEPTVFVLQTDGDLPGEAANFSKQIARFGIKNYSIPTTVFSTDEIAPGKQGVINWRFTPLGRAVKILAENDSGGDK